MVNTRAANPTKTKEDGEDLGLLSHLAKLGLGDAELARVISLLANIDGPDAPSKPRSVEPAIEEREAHEEKPFLAKDANNVTQVFLVEEQQILRDAYQSFFADHPTIEILGSSNDTSTEALVQAAEKFKPKVLVLGVKTVQPATVDTLEALREACPDVALVLLFAFYDGQGIKALRHFSRDRSAGCAYLLKHTIDTVDQLTQVISGVAEGRIIVDPMVMEGLIKTDDAHSGVLQELSPRELEVLSWIAKGYRNDTIADLLSRDVKTVERHINNIYGKLQDIETGDDSRDRRVSAALKYLRATGLLPAEQFSEE